MTTINDRPERDPPLDVAWKAQSDEMPSAQLDAGILAAARRAVASAPESAGAPKAAAADVSANAARRARRWHIPLAAAATLSVVTLGVLLTRPQQPAVRAPSAVPAPPATPVAGPAVTARKAAAAAPSVEQGAAQIAASPALAREAVAQDRVRERREAVQIAETPTLAFTPAPEPANELAPASMAASAAQIAPAPAPVAAPAQVGAVARASTANALSEKKASAVAADSATPFDTDASVARIIRLHEEGKLAAAADELKVLRAAIPDADRRLPEKLRAWAASIEP